MRLHAGESFRHYFVVVNAAGRIGQHPTSANTQRFDVPDCIAVAALSIGAMVSFFALNCSCINAGSRVIYAMGRHGIFHEATADSHETNETPHIAVTTM